ncbi:hypothetical protein [Actinocrispum sp. NPDC049592]|uniref:hypothetical protein n=1 Tax=Actinocrispum sp. NPDC049592 TaxID=3154835 RepID=UPI00342F083B
MLVWTRTSAKTHRAGLIAHKPAEHLPEGMPQQWLYLDDLPLPDFNDTRHTSCG